MVGSSLTLRGCRDVVVAWSCYVDVAWSCLFVGGRVVRFVVCVCVVVVVVVVGDLYPLYIRDCTLYLRDFT